MRLTPNFYRDRACLNMLAGSKENVRGIYATAEGHVLVDVLSKNYPNVASAVKDMRGYAAFIDNALSVGLGADDPNQSAMISEISRQVQPQHVNQIFAGVATSRALLGQQGTMVNSLVSPAGTPGGMKTSTGPLNSRSPDGIVSVETAIALLKDTSGSSIKYFSIDGLKCRDEYIAVTQACARHDFWLEPTGNIDLDNFTEILQTALDTRVNEIIPHIYSSIIDKVSGNTRPGDVHQLMAMTRACVGQLTDEETDARFPNQRLAQLFDALQNEAPPQGELAQRLSVSARTIRVDITTLNALLNQYGVQFVPSRGNGYQLKINDPAGFHTLQTQQFDTLLRTPRTNQGQIHWLMVCFLTSAFSLKLGDLADEWFISRAMLQNNMAEVHEHLQHYHLTLEMRLRRDMKLFGSEMAIRACLTDLLWTLAQQDPQYPLMMQEAPNTRLPEQLQPVLQDIFARFHIRLVDGDKLFLRLYCAVAVRRISEGYPFPDLAAEEVGQSVYLAAQEITAVLHRLADKPLSVSEENWLQAHIATRQAQEIAPGAINADDDEALVNYTLRFINAQYNYNLLNDKQLHTNLLTHIKTMITRMRYQIMIPNPLLENTKQHYPMVWDMTLAAVSGWGKYTPYTISENEIGFLVLHIDVGLKRSYNVGYQRQPKVLLICDARDAMARVIGAALARKYPQIEIVDTVTLHDYEQRESISEDFVIPTAWIGEEDKPVVMIVSFPTDYQLEQIGRLVLVDRTYPWVLNKFFDAVHFCVIDESMDQQTLFKALCHQLQDKGFVDAEFLDSVVEREAIVSIILGDSIALPHALGLLAKKTVVYTILVPQGITWDDETAHVIFSLAISKSEYEEAMAIYDILVVFLRERAMTRFCARRNFIELEAVTMEYVSRF